MTNIDHVLMIGFGAPTQAAEIMPFLQSVTRGRKIPEERLIEVAHHYEMIGGSSPYNQACFDLAIRFQSEMRAAQLDLPVYVGMRTWHPFIADVLDQIERDGCRHGFAFILAPHQSEASYDRYIQSVWAALGSKNLEIHYTYAKPWFDHPGFIRAHADKLSKKLEAVNTINDYSVIFSAHSIPVSMHQSQTYAYQFTKSAQLIASQLNRTSWQCGYQSRSGHPREVWLQPSVESLTKAAAQAGKKGIVVDPVGFLCDNAEVIYDLDIALKKFCTELKLEYQRADTVMDHPSFVSMFYEILAQAISYKEKPCSI